MSDCEIAFIGAGNMAEAISRAVIGAGLARPERVLACDPSAERRAVFASLGCRVAADNAAAAGCATVFLSVKPQMFDAAVSSLKPHVDKKTLLISIAAGIRTERIARVAGPGPRIVRVMPNTPVQSGKGMSAVARGRGATSEDAKYVLGLFGAAGKALELPEELLDAVTAISGSGPAYFFKFVESLAAAGIAAGLGEAEATELSRQTLIGSARLLEESGLPAAELRRRVTSPGGTTAAALLVFEERGLDEIVEQAALAARDRSVELSA